MRYCVDIYGWNKASFDKLDKARRYCIGKAAEGNRGYIWSSWDADAKLIGFVTKDIVGYRYHSRGESWKMTPDGGIVPKKKPKTWLSD